MPQPVRLEIMLPRRRDRESLDQLHLARIAWTWCTGSRQMRMSDHGWLIAPGGASLEVFPGVRERQ
jgi:hypothetical protein